MEANKIATSEEYTVIPGRSLSKGEWLNMRKTSAALPSGQVCPSPSILTSPNGIPPIDPSKLTESQKVIIDFYKKLTKRVLKFDIHVDIIKAPKIKFLACYGGRHLTLNLSKLKKPFFDDFPSNIKKVVQLWIHELGHEFSSDHLSSEYHDALCGIGASCFMLMFEEDEFTEAMADMAWKDALENIV